MRVQVGNAAVLVDVEMDSCMTGLMGCVLMGRAGDRAATGVAEEKHRDGEEDAGQHDSDCTLCARNRQPKPG